MEFCMGWFMVKWEIICDMIDEFKIGWSCLLLLVGINLFFIWLIKFCMGFQVVDLIIFVLLSMKINLFFGGRLLWF